MVEESNQRAGGAEVNSKERLERLQAAREALAAVSGPETSGRGDQALASLNRYLAAEALHERNVDEERSKDEETAGEWQ
jgi:hypothetical protein